MRLVLCTPFLMVSYFTIIVSSDCVPGEFSSHSTDCDKFLICDNGNFVELNCPPGTLFNPDINVCDWPSNVTSCGGRTENPTSTPFPSNPPVSSCQCKPELVPLYHLVKNYSDHHFYTPTKEEADQAVAHYCFEHSDSPGYVAKNALDYHCNANLERPTRLYRPVTAANAIDDHVFTLDEGQISRSIHSLGYRWDDWKEYHFYCSATAGECGATHHGWTKRCHL